MPSPLDLEAIKQANPIEQVVAETEPLTGTGRYRKAERHDSLVVDVRGQAYFWNSMGADDSGDVITWVMKHRGCADFQAAVEWLCRRAGLPAPEWNGPGAAERVAARLREDALTVAARWFVRQLRASAPAREYAHSRGWSDETIQAAGLGYSGDEGARKDLQGELSMHGVDLRSDIARAILKMPPGMLVYPHVRSGRVRYLSARSIEGKRHYNLDAELAGPRQPFFNWHWAPTAEHVVIVEGQADAVTLGQWGIPAVALAGVAADEALQQALAGHQRLYIGLDNDKAGMESAMRLAHALGPLTRFVLWPAKDANDWRAQLQADPDPTELEVMLNDAQTYVERVCIEAGQAPAARRTEAIKAAFRVIARLDEGSLAVLRRGLCRHLKIDQRQFNGILRTTREELGQEDQPEEPAAPVEVVGGYFGEHLLELIYDPAANETKLAVRFPDGTLGVQHSVTIEGTRYQAVWPSAMMSKGVVLFPSALGPELTPVELRRQVQAFIHRYLDVPRTYERLASYYVMFTWLYDCFNTVPYLRALGDSGTGKSRFLDTIGSICYRPIRTMGATTASPIFRLLDRYRGTLVLDEADFSQSDTTVEIIKVINVGFAAGTPVLRAGGDKQNFEPEAFNVYGPKILATRRKFDDDATEKRCLTHKTGGPTTRPDIPLHLESTFHAEALQLRNLLLTYRLKHWQPQIQVDESLIDRQAVEPRLNQIILGLITMVDDQELREDLKRLVAEYNQDLITERSMTLAAKVLEALVEVASGEPAGNDANGHPYWDFTLKRLAVIVNRLIDQENESDDEDEPAPAGDGQPAQAKFKLRRDVSIRGVAKVCRTDLQLDVARTTWGTKSRMVVWDPERVEALCHRYGVEWAAPAPELASPSAQTEPEPDAASGVM